ncbi:protein-serine O-palmitoleoyltransferase porcupine [Athalia rosae]|uniref:protein-serine O-palmitoleoyltransferase porcupine n=1 Tax=Athalia rosae TaxID=37344 RepID=UPI002033CADC|nr:protein-serine O-palmitoleoyltransferase porcupine [Athalia rosae]
MIFYDDSADLEEHRVKYEFEDEDEYEYEYEYEFEENQHQLVGDIYNHCLYPTVSDALSYIIPLLIASVSFRILAQSRYIPVRVFHGGSIVFGLWVVQRYASECLYLFLTLVTVTYLILQLPRHCPRSPAVGFSCICIMLYGEKWMDPTSWHKVRGVIMIAAMKVVAVAFDEVVAPLPGALEYMGYVFCPATSIFGPWISYKDYTALYGAVNWSLQRVLLAVGYLLLALFFLSVSNCWAEWIFADSKWKWFEAYGDALSFRCSHYFISYTSGSLAVLGGFSSLASTVTKPWSIELPRSLVQVVIHWNIPMHTWLKIYVFRRSHVRFGKFGAVLLTYAASSLLHGLNFPLAAVLLSLGFYTYVEYQLRFLLAYVFDACIAAKNCADYKCIHKRTSSNCWWVSVINFIFSGLTVFHLAYLGLMFDTSEQQETGYSYTHTMDKWSSLGFASHWVVLATYFAYFLIK